MAQHDYSIANQTFPNTRQDLNNSLSAIVSKNSGATPPSTTYAYQWWYDENTDSLKMRNADNDAWIKMFTFDQTADTYSLGNDTGSATISGDLTVDTDTLYVDSSNNRVGVGTTSPSDNLEINADNPAIRLTDTTNSAYARIVGVDGDLYIDADRGDSDSNSIIRFGIDNSEAMRIESDGNVGIGTNSPVRKLEIAGNNNAGAKANYIRITDTDTSATGGNQQGGIEFYTSDSGQENVTASIENLYAGSGAGSELTFNTAQNGGAGVSERMRIDESGNVLINTDTYDNNAENLDVNSIVLAGPLGRILCHSSSRNLELAITAGDTTTKAAVQFFREGSIVGQITTDGSSTSYVTSSDHRLKENVDYTFDATTRLKQLKPARFNFIADADTTVDGFLAHEVQDIVPEAISGEKDETETKEKVVVNANGQVIAENIEEVDWENGKIADEDGNTKYPIDSIWEATKIIPVYQGIDQSKLVPLLVKTIQELEARITVLENA